MSSDDVVAGELPGWLTVADLTMQAQKSYLIGCRTVSSVMILVITHALMRSHLIPY